MDIKIQTIEGTKSDPLNNRIIQKIEKTFGPYPFVKNAKVLLKSDNNRSGKNRIMEIQIEVLNGGFFAETKDINLFKALDKNINKLKRQLEKYKEKRYKKSIEKTTVRAPEGSDL